MSRSSIMTSQLIKVKHSDDSAENIEEKTIPIRNFFLKKWGHPFLCEIDDNDSLTINFNPIKLCSHWKKGKAKDRQNAINKETVSLNNQYKTSFDLRREKIQQNEISTLWYQIVYKKFMTDHVIKHMDNKTIRDNCEEQ